MSLEALSLNSRQRERLAEAAEVYAQQFDERGQAYLEGRGLAGAQERFGLGVVGDPLPGHEQYTGRLVLPYRTPAGVVSLKFRDMGGDDGPKYLGLSGAAGTPRLFNVMALHTTLGVVAICEGEFDAMALTLAGLPAVGVPGVSSWQKHYPRVFADYETVYVIADNDVKTNTETGELDPNYGQKFASKVVDSIRAAVNVVPPANIDVNQWLVRDGAEKVLESIGVSSSDLRDYLVNLTHDEDE